MKILLEECLPKDLRKCLVGYECGTVPGAGFSGKRNGELLALAEHAGWQVFLTVDQGIEYQQNLIGFDVDFKNLLRSHTQRNMGAADRNFRSSLASLEDLFTASRRSLATACGSLMAES